MSFTTPVLNAISRLASYYNSGVYNSSTNPGGMDNGGHRTNFVPSLQDLALIAPAVATEASAAASSASAASSSASAAAGSASSASTSAASVAGLIGGAKCFSGAYNLSDDGVRIIDLAAAADGFGFIIFSQGGSNNIDGIVAFRAGSGPLVKAIAVQANVNVVAGGGALAGSTGVDGKFNVSVDATKKLYLENRIGGGAAGTYFIVCS